MHQEEALNTEGITGPMYRCEKCENPLLENELILKTVDSSAL